MFVTRPYPLQLFLSIKERLSVQQADGLRRLSELLKGVDVTADSYRSIEPALVRRRGEALALLREQQRLQFLFASLKAAIRSAENAASIPEIQDRIAFYEHAITLWDGYLVEQPSREAREEQVKGLISQLEGLKSSGSSESASHQRQAVRSVTVNVPPVGREDLNEWYSEINQLKMTLELERAELQRLLVQSTLSLRVADGAGDTLLTMGLQGDYVSEEPEQQAAVVEAETAANA